MSGFQVAISIFQVSNHYPGQGFKLQFPSFKFQTMIQVKVSSCNFQVSCCFKPRSRMGVSSCNFQVSSFKQPRSKSGLQVANYKLQVSKQDPGQGFKLQLLSCQLQTSIQVRVSSCKFQDSSSKPISRSGLQVAISNCQDSNLDPGQGFESQFPSFQFQTKIQVGVARSSFSCLVCAFMDGHVCKLRAHE